MFNFIAILAEGSRMKKGKLMPRVVTIIISILCVGPSLATLQGEGNRESERAKLEPASEAIKETPPAIKPSEEIEQAPLPLDNIRRFVEVYTKIKKHYVEEVSDAELIDKAILGMVRGIDPHSEYYSEAEANLLKYTSSDEGTLGGVFETEDGSARVVSTFQHSPADKAGLLPDDRIIQIDDKDVSTMTITDIIRAQRGKIGQVKKLLIVRKSIPEPIEFLIPLMDVEDIRVSTKQLNDKIAYLSITHFHSATADSVRRKIHKLKKNSELTGLLIDLRNNPGGLLKAAVAISDLFIKKGTIVSTRKRDGTFDTIQATGYDILNGMPIVIVINENTASAAEVFAGALQDNKRAVVLGNRSFGKGTVQTVMDLSDTHVLLLTTARYYTPSGNSIQATGIRPDVEIVQRDMTELQDNRELAFREENLFNRLDNDVSQEKVKKVALPKILENDHQLLEAYNLLKGMVLYKSASITN
jgi:carboxyl-terminal processing protease